ncbi:plasmid mobilization relaxosome protein MobC [uncultured Pedobacter sp.]|uniref:plasmid mobilization protein n=1 Tax=uncultured Pedobacter sp. TaxID=246139 RepID=UPI0026256309|nr:plasmid mobilization relaxosome protein MobC [uncultured Pedobacter sp.]
MEENREYRKRWLHLRLTEEEYQKLISDFSRTTEKKLARYARKVFLAQPVVVLHRDRSMDELIIVLTKLQADLNGIANNYNQMVHKLHMSDSNQEVLRWIRSYEQQKKALFDNIEEIKLIITTSAKLWLR